MNYSEWNIICIPCSVCCLCADHNLIFNWIQLTWQAFGWTWEEISGSTMNKSTVLLHFWHYQIIWIVDCVHESGRAAEIKWYDNMTCQVAIWISSSVDSHCLHFNKTVYFAFSWSLDFCVVTTFVHTSFHSTERWSSNVVLALERIVRKFRMTKIRLIRWIKNKRKVEQQQDTPQRIGVKKIDFKNRIQRYVRGLFGTK